MQEAHTAHPPLPIWQPGAAVARRRARQRASRLHPGQALAEAIGPAFLTPVHSATQEGTTRAMLAHCGMPWEPGVLAFHTTQRTVSTASLAQVRH